MKQGVFSSPRRLLFLHGAGGYEEDQPLAHELAAALGSSLRMPHLPEEDMSLEAWANPIRTALASLEPDDVVIGHSFGASVVLHVLSEQTWPVTSATLLAIPHWGPQGWNVAEYALAEPPPKIPLLLHHCRDDEVVPFAHIALNQTDLPTAQVYEYPHGGHQFHGLAKRSPSHSRGRSPSNPLLG